jgi:chemotaxis protein histidine kinase CheA
MAFDPRAVLDDFRAEAADNLKTLGAQLLLLERDPSDPGPIRAMFVAAHTIKGSAAMLGLTDVRDLAHAVEDVLAQLREFPRPLDRQTADLLFSAIDQLHDLVARAVPGESAPDGSLTATVAALRDRARALSLGSPEAAQASEAPPAMPAAPVQPPRILLVEHSPTVRMLARMQLTEAGYHVDALGDGAEALVRAVEDAYDLIVASVEIPGVRGFDLAAALRGSRTRKDVPIVLLSTDDDPAGRQRAAELGVRAFVQKGSRHSATLVATVQQIVGPSVASPSGVGC